MGAGGAGSENGGDTTITGSIAGGSITAEGGKAGVGSAGGASGNGKFGGSGGGTGEGGGGGGATANGIASTGGWNGGTGGDGSYNNFQTGTPKSYGGGGGGGGNNNRPGIGWPSVGPISSTKPGVVYQGAGWVDNNFTWTKPEPGGGIGGDTNWWGAAAYPFATQTGSGTNGSPQTGGGGGGNGVAGPGGYSGGSGIVIIRVPSPWS